MPDLVEIARAALLEVTPGATVGAHSASVEQDGVTTVTFHSAMAGYPGWQWTVAVSTLAESEPSVLEVELTPGDGALLAPDWVPWSERLAEYEAAQEAQAVDETDDGLEGAEADDAADARNGQGAEHDDDDLDDDLDDDDDDDDDDLDDDEDEDDLDDEDDDLGSDVLHGGDLDGVDIDEDDPDDAAAADDDPDDDAPDEHDLDDEQAF